MPEPARDAQLVALGQTIRRVRRAKDLTQEALAQRADLHPTLIGPLERGKDMRLSTAFKLARGLGVSLDELLRQSADDVPEPGASRAVRR